MKLLDFEKVKLGESRGRQKEATDCETGSQREASDCDTYERRVEESRI